jgi:hypothetical protein
MRGECDGGPVGTTYRRSEGPTIHFDRPPAGTPTPHLIRFPVGPAVLWVSAEPVRRVQGELLKFRPVDFGPR